MDHHSKSDGQGVSRRAAPHDDLLAGVERSVRAGTSRRSSEPSQLIPIRPASDELVSAGEHVVERAESIRVVAIEAFALDPLEHVHQMLPFAAARRRPRPAP